MTPEAPRSYTEKEIDRWCEMLNKSAKTVHHFSFDGTDFSAYHEAEKFVKRAGFKMGSMCEDYPIALSANPNMEYIGKWRNIDRTEWNKIDGLMISTNFRNSHVAVVFYI